MMRKLFLIVLLASLSCVTVSLSAQTLRNTSGSSIGKVESDGTVRNASGSRIGRIERDGTIRNSSGSSIGKAESVDPRAAAIVFFFGYLLM